LADLGQSRYDQDVAAVGDRDHAFFAAEPLHVARGRAPKGLEAQVFAWNLLQHDAGEKDDREELKGDLHGGQLHRANRAALHPHSAMPPPSPMTRGGGDGGRERGRKGRGGGQMNGNGKPHGSDSMIAAMKPDKECAPQAKGIAAELSADLFWNGPI
ncbi:hypothetical protein BCR34DRAFT_453578, partial [Clohesyomyces aquaticus]